MTGFFCMPLTHLSLQALGALLLPSIGIEGLSAPTTPKRKPSAPMIPLPDSPPPRLLYSIRYLYSAPTSATPSNPPPYNSPTSPSQCSTQNGPAPNTTAARCVPSGSTRLSECVPESNAYPPLTAAPAQLWEACNVRLCHNLAQHLGSSC
jgi:hypothetical protein